MSLPSLSTKLDTAVNELSALLKNANETIKAHNLRLDAIKLAMATNRPSTGSTLIDYQASNLGETREQSPSSNLGNNTSTLVISPHESFSLIERAVKNITDKDKRKCNIIIFNIPDTSSFCDDK